MKNFLSLIVLTLTLFQVQAQNDEPILFMWYGQIKTSDAAEHLQLEKDYYSKFHQQRVENGDILGWDMWQIMNPDVNDMTTTYIYVSLVKDFASIGKNTPIKSLKGVSQKEWDAAQKKAMGHYLKTYQVVASIKGSFGTQEATGPADYAVINYMEVDPYQTEAYEKLEIETFLPMFKDEKIRKGWALHKVLNHFGTDRPVNYITADFYDSIQTVYKTRNGAIALNEEDLKFWKGIDEIRELKNSHILKRILSVR
ncbi:MAG: hypothetical protein L7S43_04740 [Flavobacteriaceae bacterium]|nr:hypothetical protein [Flavobacteriaceae bacterium]